MVKEAAARSRESVENLYRQHPRFDVAGSGGIASTIIILGVRLGNDVNSQVALPSRSGDQLAGAFAPWTVRHRRSRLGFPSITVPIPAPSLPNGLNDTPVGYIGLFVIAEAPSKIQG